MFQSRTHTCNELRLENAGEQVRIVGWMENVREVGQNFAFVVVRDFYGTTQVVIETEDMMKVVKALNKESTIAVEGTVRERASKNPKLPTGDIEVVPTKIEVLGRCRYNELPFEINRSRDADEALRLKYRYLDLRNPAVKQNIILRCQVVAALRAAMTEHGFLEITTPILTASSPEGARDYLVPARKHPGKFYALPQAPQQFKQLLMTAGFDRYFQIAPCFRDEDARGDRSPGEFYQLDMEMAFATQDDVFAVLEDVLPPIFAKYGKYDIASEAPFRRISYHDAMETYGSDKPDLRIDLTVQDMTALVAGSDFAPFAAGNTVKAVVVPDCAMARKAVDKLCADVEVQAGSKPYWFKVDEQGNFAGGIAKFLTDKTAEITAALGLKPAKRPPRRRRRACCARSSAWPCRATWTGSGTNFAGSSTSRCTRSARSPASWSSATTRSRCRTAASRSSKRPSAARSTRSTSMPTSTTSCATASSSAPARCATTTPRSWSRRSSSCASARTMSRPSSRPCTTPSATVRPRTPASPRA